MTFTPAPFPVVSGTQLKWAQKGVRSKRLYDPSLRRQAATELCNPLASQPASAAGV